MTWGLDPMGVGSGGGRAAGEGEARVPSLLAADEPAVTNAPPHPYTSAVDGGDEGAASGVEGSGAQIHHSPRSMAHAATGSRGFHCRWERRRRRWGRKLTRLGGGGRRRRLGGVGACGPRGNAAAGEGEARAAAREVEGEARPLPHLDPAGEGGRGRSRLGQCGRMQGRGNASR